MAQLTESDSSSVREECPRVLQGRVEDPEFPPEEKLYRRVIPKTLVNGKPSVENFQFRDDNPATPGPNISVNRAGPNLSVNGAFCGQYSRPSCLLCPDQCPPAGRDDVVAEFTVRDLALEGDSALLTLESGQTLHAAARHMISKKPKNYAHTEIRLLNPAEEQCDVAEDTWKIQWKISQRLAEIASPALVDIDPFRCKHLRAKWRDLIEGIPQDDSAIPPTPPLAL